MASTNQYRVIEVPELRWPSGLELPRHFRLFIAANTDTLLVEPVSVFAHEALRSGAVYVCVWGSGCERFHDIVDECIVENDLSERKSADPSASDTVMTTWHDDEPIEKALEFFASWARPTDGYVKDSSLRLVICVNSFDWANRASRFLETATFIT